MGNVEIKGAKIHNLKGFDIDIPKNKLVVATGVSGSGKSSLMFDIIFEEGRREYLQALGLFPGLEDEKKFDSISGLSPTIAVQQRLVRQNNPRSTVASKTQILSMLCLLYSSEGKIICSDCGEIVGDNLICEECGNEEKRLEIGFFSYNNVNGMCMQCSGRGAYFDVNMDKIVTDEKMTVREIFHVIGVTPGIERVLERNLKEYMDMPYMEIPEDIKDEVVNGHYTQSNSDNQSFCVARILKSRQEKGEYLHGMYEMLECPECKGFRIGEEARRALIEGKHIGEVGKMTLTELKEFCESALRNPEIKQLGINLLNDILKKVNALIKSRLGYLSLYREMSTLSGGEIQRIFLNSHLESKMNSLIYILDEPTAGLHESEKEELIHSINGLTKLGNSVIVVEHDRRTIEEADYIVDIGPKAGVEGGNVIYTGHLQGLLDCECSVTGQYLSKKIEMPVITQRKRIEETMLKEKITLHNVNTNNLKNVTVSFPLGFMVGVAGVSGSGKSSLVSDALLPLIKNHFNRESSSDNRLSKIEGVEFIKGYSDVSQAPIGRNNNSNPMTFIKVWDKIRKLFAEQPIAKELDLTAGHFSFNSKGACEECGGSGRKAVFPDGSMMMYTTCNACKGKRFNDETMSVTYKGKSIADVLEMQISEAIPFFEGIKSILSPLEIMVRIGMGYLSLGQPTSTMSGGEIQRLKLAKEIGKQRNGNILYVLDEPTTGLSMYDTAQLIKLLDELLVNGNSVIVIEHNLDILKSCDWIIELGPEGGTGGGTIIAQGSPEKLKENPHSVTGKYL